MAQPSTVEMAQFEGCSSQRSHCSTGHLPQYFRDTPPTSATLSCCFGIKKKDKKLLKSKDVSLSLKSSDMVKKNGSKKTKEITNKRRQIT